MCALRGGEYVAYDRADYRSALKIWLPLARRGDPIAQTYVGEIYENGMGTKESLKIAALWYEKASKQGFARAMINLGYLYEVGLGVKKDWTKALNLYREASGFTEGNLEFISSLDLEKREQAKMKAIHDQDRISMLQSQLKFSTEKLLQTERNKPTIQTPSSIADTGEPEPVSNTPDISIQSNDTSDSDRRERKADSKPAHIEQKTVVDIIDPPLKLHQNETYLLTPEGRKVDILGKVSPTSSIYAFRINGEDVPYTKSGLFRFKQNNFDTDAIKFLAIRDDGDVVRHSYRLFQSTGTVTDISSPTVPESVRAPPLPSHEGLNLGNYYALIIGNENYQNIGEVRTARADANLLNKTLKEKYGFNTRLLINATQIQLLSALDELRSSLTDNDNLIIYYAGHGKIDSQGRGYWLPVDADEDDTNSWISNEEAGRLVDSLSAKHILIIADSCFTGTLTRSSIVRPLPTLNASLKKQWLSAVSRSKVRTVLSSGTISPVAASEDKPDNSLFSRYLVESLNENDNILEAYRLYVRTQKAISASTEIQELESSAFYSPIKHSGHEAGEFLFLPINNKF
ncbi:MAG: caspase family protein [Granulosicoccus sp.]|nr:caspase family protein [Granulosicoccus sp.]